MNQRGITQQEVILAIRTGRRSPAINMRIDFVQDFTYNNTWHGIFYNTKRVIVTVEINNNIYNVKTVKSKNF